VLSEVFHPRQFADGFQLDQLKRPAKGKEVAVEHSSEKARVVRGRPQRSSFRAAWRCNPRIGANPSAMSGLAYLFERFPSFTQTFCYREIAELCEQTTAPDIFSVRRPQGEPPQDWDSTIINDVRYLPDDKTLTTEIDRALRKTEFPDAVKTAIAGWGRKTDFLRLYQAAWLGLRLQERGVGHVHVHFAGLAARTAYWLKKFYGISYSVTAHANDIFAPKPFEISLGNLIAEARAVVTVSDFAVQFLREKFPDDAEKLVRIYNGIELEGFRPTDFSAAPPLILSVGRLIEKKGFSDLIAACRLLRERGLDFRCEIIGEGPLEEQLRREIAAAGLTDFIFLSGPLPQKEVIARLAVGTVFVLPCVTEIGGGMDNLPTVIMEAMAAALPVISTPIGGVPEMVINEESGLLVPEHHPAALADALTRIVSSRELAQSLGRNALDRATRLFDIRKNVAGLRDLLLELSRGERADP
jgi:glycosyltransferase involved in cell wall biosynthesis